MNFYSILFQSVEDAPRAEMLQIEAPPFFVDLNLNQVVEVITHGKEEYDLNPFFYTPLHTKDEINYRQEIMKDIETPSTLTHLQIFAFGIHAMRKQLPDPKNSYYKFEKERLFLDAVKIYCDTVTALSNNLSKVDLKSQGLLSFRQYLTNYIQAENFTSLFTETKNLLSDLSGVNYCVLTKDLHVQVLSFKHEADYSAEVENTFEKFKQGAVKDYKNEFPPSRQMNHVEAAILEGVAQLNPEIFNNLIAFNEKHANFSDERISIFDREIQFYISYLEYVSKIRKTGLNFCYPEICTASKVVICHDGFDLALAYKLVNENAAVICNDFFLDGEERIIVVSGPNQGGKTTFARTFGQLHYLASIGCLVPGKKAKLSQFDKLFTHFEKEENLKNLRSKLEDDLIRIHDILEQATPSSIIIMNEILSSTTLQDAIFLNKKIMEKIDKLDVLCVWVTFIDELLLLSKKTVSMVSTVVPENPATRTFKIERRPADGLAYALSIAEKYHVTYDSLKKRLNR